jgi:hypothetical protein
MANLAGFDASQVPEQEEFRALPKGVYAALATDSEMKPTKAGTGEYLQFVFEVLDGPGKGRKLWARMNIRNPNQMAQDIGQRELATLCKAVGIPRPTDSSELHNIPVLLHVDTELDDRKRETNVIKRYEALNGGGQQQQQSHQSNGGNGGNFGNARRAASDTANSYSPPADNAAAGGAAQPWRR